MDQTITFEEFVPGKMPMGSGKYLVQAEFVQGGKLVPFIDILEYDASAGTWDDDSCIVRLWASLPNFLI